MEFKFLIKKGSFKFAVTVSSQKVTVKPLEPCKYENKVCEVLARSQEIMIGRYISRNNSTQDVCNCVYEYWQGRNWLINEISERQEKDTVKN